MSAYQLTTKKRGDIGLGMAIGVLTAKGATVSLPLTDSQDYDLIVDLDGALQRVQVKTVSYHRHGYFQVNLACRGGNRSKNAATKKNSGMAYDLFFVVTENGDCYLIPKSQLTAEYSFALTEEWDTYRVADMGGSLCSGLRKVA